MNRRQKIKTNTKQSLWFHTDEAEDVAGSVRHVLRCATYVGEDAQEWKWIVLALHGALQGACVCHLTTVAAPIGAVTEKNECEWTVHLDAQSEGRATPQPKRYLMSLPDLLKKLRNRGSGAGDLCEGIPISDRELAWLARFHREFSNQFVHFERRGWSIEVSGIPDLARLVARIVAGILERGWAFRHLDVEARSGLKRDLQSLADLNWPA